MLSASQARNCYEQINGTSLQSLRCSLYQLAIDYATIRSQWPLMTLEQRKEIGRAHV